MILSTLLDLPCHGAGEFRIILLFPATRCPGSAHLQGFFLLSHWLCHPWVRVSPADVGQAMLWFHVYNI